MCTRPVLSRTAVTTARFSARFGLIAEVDANRSDRRLIAEADAGRDRRRAFHDAC